METFMPDPAETRFHSAILDIYNRAKRECGYNATRFLAMIVEHGGVETARILLRANTVTDGYTALWERGRLDLTVEALVLQPAWVDIFTCEERATARKRLAEYGYNVASP
jgi:hypothetical protein